ncbi:replicative DNA helicase [Actinoplanes campanulatus]|uniref:DNA 5'-3' helicase n=1 Tax=Actinoplanes campanulatus TaxID=113559 RepID=A0A7W5AME7_9ACTN|nr:replicative DNA helicase [Actinoplanes campanulatus]MBB3098972.1 replicative DNA helicase [Actinoplanes campanulatus]GGN39632.1 replicative DNA helicase [Actinoplanes campanulatus]
MSIPTQPTRHLQAVEDVDWSKHPMSDLAAEQAVLGMMMTSPKAIDEVIDHVAGRDFADNRHVTLFHTLVLMWGDNIPSDPTLVARQLDTNGDLLRVGGVPYLHTLTEKIPTTTGTPRYHARIVADWAKRRRVREAGLRIVHTSQTLDKTVDEVIDAAQQDIHAATVSQSPGNLLAYNDFHDGELDHLEKLMNGEVRRGMSTGLGTLDDLIGGFLPGQLVVPAGRPGMGKSTCGLGFAIAAARRGIPALIYSLEMSRRELTWRLLSAVGGIDLGAFTTGRLTPDQHDKAKKASKTIAGWPLHIDDQTHTVADIRTSARRFRQRHNGLGLVFVDYLQRLRTTTKHDRRDLEVGRNASDLKTLGQELEATMVVPAQLNRGPESRTDKRPQLSDLRDSGEIEQEADIVILLHRDDYYDKESPRAGEADFIVAKYRNGPTDTVTVAAQLHLSRFTDFGIGGDR